MVLAVEQIEEKGEELAVWNLPEKLPENPNVRLRVLGDFSSLTPGELTRVNFGVVEAARAIAQGGGVGTGFGYRLKSLTPHVYSIRHDGVGSQDPVEGLITVEGPVYEPEIILFQAKSTKM